MTLNKQQLAEIEEALADIETYMVRCSDRHRQNLRRMLRKLVRRCLRAECAQASGELEHLRNVISMQQQELEILQSHEQP